MLRPRGQRPRSAGGATIAEHDVVIRGGTVYDGTGGPGRVADVALEGDRIAAVGTVKDRGGTEIDASGLAVTPGFINMLSHANASLTQDGRSQADIRQGVTLEVFGEGWLMGPLNAKMKRDALEQQIDVTYDITWDTLDGFLRYLETKGISTNVASFVSATNLRINEVDHDDRPPTAAELERMRVLMRRAMKEGALGLATALIYAPATYAKTDELVALSAVAGEFGGMYISHMRNEDGKLFEAIDELVAIAKGANVPAEIYHFKQAGPDNWSKIDGAIARVEAARAAGLRITADMYLYPASSTGLNSVLPSWAHEGGHHALIERLRAPDTRARIKAEIGGPRARWDAVRPVSFRKESLRPLIGRTIADIAQERGVSGEDATIDLLIEDDSRITCVFFSMSEANVKRAIALPWMSFGSDGGSPAAEGIFLRSSVHPRTYGNFARLLGKYVREERVIPLAEAIRRLTSFPATVLGLPKRGTLAPGAVADVVVFDPATIRDNATFEAPHQYATGVAHVLVNGVGVIKNGEHTGATPGRVVRRAVA